MRESPSKFLPYLPEPVIQCLLNEAIGDTRPPNSSDHPIRLIKDWVLAGSPGHGEGVRRRKLLSGEVQKWLSNGGDIQVVLSSIPIILSPMFENVEPDPGSGMSITIYSDILTIDEMLDVQALWPLLLSAIGLEILSGWAQLRETIHEWAYNMTRTQHALPDEMERVKRNFAATMIGDLRSLASAHPAILHALKDISQHANLGVGIPVDPNFEILYPERSKETGGVTNEQVEIVHQLALEWSRLGPQVALKEVAFIEQEAKNAGVGWPRLTVNLCEHIAANARASVAWLKTAIDKRLSPDLILPFLKKAAEYSDEGWIVLAQMCLDDMSLRESVINLSLTMPSVPDILLDQALQHLSGFENLVNTCCIRNEVPERVLRRLLTHPEISIVRAAVIGMWYSTPKGVIPDGLRADWENAIIELGEDSEEPLFNAWAGQEEILLDILQSDSKLAYEWLKARLMEADVHILRMDKVFSVAATLDTDKRRRLLHDLPLNKIGETLARFLIGNDLILYQELLNDERLRKFHLVPIRSGTIDVEWVGKAKLALDAGYSGEKIGSAVLFIPRFFGGKESDMWKGLIERFEWLETQEDERIREIGAMGKAQATEFYNAALNRERDDSIYGRN
ncbi:MAG: hypothetical protein ACYDBJ_23640 [Aggregatilineales bacterium]